MTEVACVRPPLLYNQGVHSMASPLLNFAIIGRKSSGKTCLLTALASPRDANPNGINCDLSRAKERYSEYLNQEVIKDFFKLSNGSIATYDEMLQIIDLHKKELVNKHFPSATALSGKSLCIYNFDTKDRVSFDVGLFDYAGELVDAESNLADDLKKVLGKMSALMILVELGETDEKSKTKTALDISNLQQFFKSIEANGDNCSRFNIPIALLITKADKYVTIDYKQYCEDKEYSKLVIERILATEHGSNLRNLMNSIEVCTNEGLFNVFPISSFGNIGKEEFVSIPLKSLNILEPFYWAVKSWAKNIITTTDKEISSKGKLSLILSCLAKDYTKDLNTAVALLPDSCPNKAKGKELVEHLSGAGIKGLVGIAIMALAILLCGEFVFDYSHIWGIKHRELTLSNAPKKIAWLDDYLDSSIFRHRLAKSICLSTEESAKYLKEIYEKYDELFWEDTMNCSDAKMKESKLEEYKNTFPNGLHSKETTEIAKVISENNAKDIWVNSLVAVEGKIGEIKSGLKSLDDNTYEALSQAIVKLNSLNKTEYDMSDRLEKVVRDFESISNEKLQKAIEVKKSEITTCLNNKVPADWNEALKLTWEIKNMPGMKIEDWKNYASEIVMQNYYGNYDKYLKDVSENPNVDLNKLKMDLDKGNTCVERRSIADEVGWLDGEREWFENHLKLLKLGIINKKYLDLVQFSKNSSNDFKDFFNKSGYWIPKIDSLINDINEFDQLKPYAVDLECYKKNLNNIQNLPQKVLFYVKEVDWPTDGGYGFGSANRRLRVIVNDVIISDDRSVLSSNGKTWILGNKENDLLHTMSEFVELRPEEDKFVRIQISLKDDFKNESRSALEKDSNIDDSYKKKNNLFFINENDKAEALSCAGIEKGLFGNKDLNGKVIVGSHWLNPSFELPELRIEK